MFLAQGRKRTSIVRMSARPWEDAGGLFRSVVDAISDGVTIVDLSGVQCFVNRAFCEMVGYEAGELVGASSPFCYWPEDQREHLSEVLRAAMGGSCEEFEVWLQKKNGQRFPALLRAGTVPEEGRVIAYVATVKDISGRKDMERALRLSEERWRAIAENPFDFVVTLDSKYRFTYVNHPAQGVRAEDLIGKATPLDFIAPEHHALVRETYERAFHELKPGSYELFVPVVGKWLSTIVGPIVVDGVATGISLQTRDVTSQKLAEQALRQAQRMEALGRLAGGIAHDFNNLLLPILGNASLAQLDLAEDHPTQAKLADIVRAAELASELVSRVLLFGREQPRQRQAVRVQDVACEVARFMSAAAPPKVRIETELDDACPPVLGAVDELHQVVTNLCTNAIQAVAEQGGTVTLAVERAEAAESSVTVGGAEARASRAVRLLVRDTGAGIPEALQARVFDPFFSTRPVGQGTGLGLSIVQSIVTRYGGSVSLDSRSGFGTRVLVLLPACDEAVPSPAEESRPRPASHLGSGADPRASTLGSRALKLVCIDDEPLVLSWLVRTLERAGHKVRTFADPREARRYLFEASESVDCVICDETMPFLTGSELAGELAERAAAVPIVLISGYAPSTDKPLPANVRARLPKPLAAAALLSALAGALSEPSA
jgi:two-component system cell cycle sensor histidine kinase/response regulator CckA